MQVFVITGFNARYHRVKRLILCTALTNNQTSYIVYRLRTIYDNVLNSFILWEKQTSNHVDKSQKPLIVSGDNLQTNLIVYV